METTLLYSLAFTAALLSLAILLLFWKQKQTRRYVMQLRKTFHTVLSTSTDAIMILEEDDTIVSMNDPMRHLLHMREQEKKLSEITMPEFYINNEKKHLKDLMKEAHSAQEDEDLFFAPQIEIQTRRHGQIAVDLYLGKIRKPGKKQYQHIVIIRDLREVFKEIALGERDALTRLHNRARAFKDFQMLCSKHHIHEGKITLMALSLDNFLITRSLLGHEKTDDTILAVAHTLMQLSLLHHYKMYHLNYANFLLVLEDIPSIDDALGLAKTLQERLAKLYKNHRSAVYLTASIGIASTPESGAPIALFDNVHKALIEAKKQGVGNTHFFRETSIKAHQKDFSALQHDLQYAIERNELLVFYQPIVDAETHDVVAAEALMRWQHPERGLISPFHFIPLMEKTGYIIEAGRYLIREVIRQQARWKRYGFKEIIVSLNASIREIEAPDYVDYLSQHLKENHVDAKTVKIEITESLAMNSEKKIMETLLHLHAIGTPLSLDDFGTGYTSFSYLTRLPADTLKIDKSFIDNIVQDGKNQQVVQAIIEVGHALNMQIVAEGIEDKKTANLLCDYGCDYLQGYYFSKPVPLFEMQSYLRKKEGFQEEKDTDGDEPLLLHSL